MATSLPSETTSDFAFANDAIGIDATLLASARALGPMISPHAEATGRDRRLARPVLEAMREAGLFRMFTPRSLGGLEADPVTVARVAEEIASFDSAGWGIAGKSLA
jgi:indole-3-acetate monooxygenase